MRLMKIAISSTFLLTLACGGSSGTSMTDSSTGTSPGSTSETGADTGSSTASPTSGGSGSDSLSGTISTTGEPVTTSGSTVDATSDASTTSPVLSTSGAESTSAAESTSEGSTSKGETGDDTTTGVIKDCMAWQVAFDAEVLEVRGCMNDNECGVEIKGTSCGCTRNWVARLDADLSEFEGLVDLANELGCELPFISTCDCPGTNGFECAGGICNWNYD